jgi:hypothetical protein
MWCQYITPPMDADTDVIEVQGQQSLGGHHIVLYATSESQPVGTTKDCGDNDMVSVRFLGGIGGEGAQAIAKGLPSGTVFRIPKGYGLLANIHFINTTDHPIDGQGVVDLKSAPADSSKRVASLFSNVAIAFNIGPNATYTHDVNCALKQDLDILFFANHMHELGTSAYSEIIRANGTKAALREDRGWTKDDVFNLKFTQWSLDSPMKFKAGDVVHTHCEWNNPKPTPVDFPTEMCVGVGISAWESSSAPRRSTASTTIGRRAADAARAVRARADADSACSLG